MCTTLKNTTEHNIWYDLQTSIGKGKLLPFRQRRELFCVLLSLFVYDLANNQAMIRPTLEEVKKGVV